MNKYTIEVKDVKHLNAIQGAIEHIGDGLIRPKHRASRGWDEHRLSHFSIDYEMELVLGLLHLRESIELEVIPDD